MIPGRPRPGLVDGQGVRQGRRERLPPILMTAVTAGLALVPLLLKSGAPGNEIQSPMALVILGGLATSTFLNLVVVPALSLRRETTGRTATALRQPEAELLA